MNTQEISKSHQLWGVGEEQMKTGVTARPLTKCPFCFELCEGYTYQKKKKKKNLSNMEESPKYYAEQTKTYTRGFLHWMSPLIWSSWTDKSMVEKKSELWLPLGWGELGIVWEGTWGNFPEWWKYPISQWRFGLLICKNSELYAEDLWIVLGINFISKVSSKKCKNIVFQLMIWNLKSLGVKCTDVWNLLLSIQKIRWIVEWTEGWTDDRCVLNQKE